MPTDQTKELPMPAARRRNVSLLASTTIAALALAGCGPQGGPPPGGFPPALVSVVTVQPKTLPVEFEYPGQTAGSREVEVRARVTGHPAQAQLRRGRDGEAGGSRSSPSIPRRMNRRSRAPRPTWRPPKRASRRPRATPGA